MKTKVLSLFDGISIAQQALKELGFNIKYYASEIDKYAIQITQRNHPDTIQVGDITQLKGEVLHLSGVYDILREYDSNIQNKLSEREMLYWLNEDFSISAKIGTQITNADSPESASLQRIEEIWFSKSGVGDIIKTQKLIGSRVVGENGNTQTQELLLQCGEWGYVYRSNARDTQENIKGIDGEKTKNRKYRENTTSGTFTMGNTESEETVIGINKERNVETPKPQEVSDRTKEQKERGAETAGNRKEYARSKVQNVSFPLQTKDDNEAITKREWFQLSVREEMETTMVKTPNSIDIFLGKFELMCGGSPCQDLSIAKKNREGLSGSRSGLFWEYVRLLKEVKPKYFILENVNSMSKEATETITAELFGIEPVMINASLVSAHSRKRLFWVGKRNGDTYTKVDISQPEDKHIYLKDIIESGEAVTEKSYCLTTNQTDLINNFIKRHQGNYVFKDKPIRIASLGKGGQGDRIYSIHGKSVCLSANGGGRGAKTGLYLITGGAKRTRNRDGKKLELRQDGKSNSLTTVETDSLVVLKDYFRPLTPVECERLQSLPDNYTNGVSKTQRKKALGNGFNCEVIKHIIKQIYI